jgi:ATP-dependent Clp protease adaptor protein ClpS
VTSQPPSTQPDTSPGQIELEEPDTALAPLYHLILLDDDEHSYQYVIEMLGKIFGYGREKAFALAALVDNAGQVVLETAGHDQVSDHQSQVHAHGADPSIPKCKGSMSAIIEEADGPAPG